MVTEFLFCLREEGINQSQFAKRCGVGTAAISRFVGGSRPEDPLFRALCTRWEHQNLADRMVLAHLRDEIERSGRPVPGFDLKPATLKKDPTQVEWERRLQELQRHAQSVPSAARLIDALIEVLSETGRPAKIEKRVSHPNMKLLTIGTKAQADKILVGSLFTPGGTLTPTRFDRARYKATPSLRGRELSVPNNVHALWTERRKDKEGPYQVLFCLTSRKTKP